MKTIKDSLHDIIFRSIVVEAKASYDKFDITFDEFCSDKANLELKGEEVIELNKFAQDNNIVVVSKSFKSGFDYAKNYSDKYDYQNIFVVLPFEELNVVFKLKKHKGVTSTTRHDSNDTMCVYFHTLNMSNCPSTSLRPRCFKCYWLFIIYYCICCPT